MAIANVRCKFHGTVLPAKPCKGRGRGGRIILKYECEECLQEIEALTAKAGKYLFMGETQRPSPYDPSVDVVDVNYALRDAHPGTRLSRQGLVYDQAADEWMETATKDEVEALYPDRWGDSEKRLYYLYKKDAGMLP